MNQKRMFHFISSCMAMLLVLLSSCMLQNGNSTQVSKVDAEVVQNGDLGFVRLQSTQVFDFLALTDEQRDTCSISLLGASQNTAYVCVHNETKYSSYETLAILTFDAQQQKLNILLDFRKEAKPRAIRNLIQIGERLFFVELTNLDSPKQLLAGIVTYQAGTTHRLYEMTITSHLYAPRLLLVQDQLFAIEFMQEGKDDSCVVFKINEQECTRIGEMLGRPSLASMLNNSYQGSALLTTAYQQKLKIYALSREGRLNESDQLQKLDLLSGDYIFNWDEGSLFVVKDNSQSIEGQYTYYYLRGENIYPLPNIPSQFEPLYVTVLDAKKLIFIAQDADSRQLIRIRLTVQEEDEQLTYSLDDLNTEHSLQCLTNFIQPAGEKIYLWGQDRFSKDIFCDIYN